MEHRSAAPGMEHRSAAPEMEHRLAAPGKDSETALEMVSEKEYRTGTASGTEHHSVLEVSGMEHRSATGMA